MKDATEANDVNRFTCVFIVDVVFPPLARNQTIFKHEMSECRS